VEIEEEEETERVRAPGVVGILKLTKVWIGLSGWEGESERERGGKRGRARARERERETEKFIDNQIDC
jgi:hypothetical protein